MRDFEPDTLEPQWVLRASDPAAPGALRAWAELTLANGGDRPLAVMAYRFADLMDQWRQARNLGHIRTHVPVQPGSQPCARSAMLTTMSPTAATADGSLGIAAQLEPSIVTGDPDDIGLAGRHH